MGMQGVLSIQAAMAKTHGLGSLRRKHVFLMVLEVEEPKVRPADSVSVESLLPGSPTAISSLSSHGRQERELSGLFYKGTNPIYLGA